MSRLLGMLGSAIGYFCVATVLAQAVLLGVLAHRWQLDREKLVRMLAVAYGIDLSNPKGTETQPAEPPSTEMPSFNAMLETRAVKVRHMELREQALREGLEQLRGDQRRLAGDQQRFEQVRDGFQKELLALKQGAGVEGMDEVRQTLESIKPAQAKIQLMKMLGDNELDRVVSLLSGMASSKRAKIVAEFKTEEETEKLREILRRLGEGTPPIDQIESTRQKLTAAAPGGM